MVGGPGILRSLNRRVFRLTTRAALAWTEYWRKNRSSVGAAWAANFIGPPNPVPDVQGRQKSTLTEFRS